MKVLTNALYKENFELDTNILGPIVVNGFQIKLANKYIIEISDVALIL